MTPYDRGHERLATILLIRGFALLALAAIAVRWPEESLADAIRYAAGIAVFLGLVELGVALSGRVLLSTRAFRVGHALTSVTFGILAGMAAVLPADRALVRSMVWLSGYAAFVLLLAARLSYLRPVRDALVFWAVVNVGAVAACAKLAGQPKVSVLLGGALYTAALGIATITAARWMRRGSSSARRPTPLAYDQRR